MPDPISARGERDTYVADGVTGCGGMGTVLSARDSAGRAVALKVMSRVSPTTLRRFRREIAALQRIRSPHVIELLDHGTLPSGMPFYVMPLCEGQTLASLMHDAPPSPAQAAQLLAQLCLGVEAVHAAGVVHRDLKPSNLLVSADDDGAAQLQIIDFGVARIDDDPTVSAGELAGSLYYAAPEQLRGEAVSAATDLYAVGVIAYQLIAGSLPFDKVGGHPALVVSRLLAARPRPLVEAAPHAPRRWADLVDRCLQAEPSERPASARALQRVFASSELPAQRAAHTRRTPGTTGTTGTPSRRRIALIAAVVAMLGALALIGRATLSSSSPAAASPTVQPSSAHRRDPRLRHDGAARRERRTADRPTRSSSAPAPAPRRKLRSGSDKRLDPLLDP